MARCDLCDEYCGASDLVQLLEPYQVCGVVDICPRCRKWADKLKNSLIDEFAPKMQSAIAERKGASYASKIGWSRRVFGAKK